jgi:protein translocase SecG subunit
MKDLLIYSQLVVAVLLIAAVLLQQRGQALGATFGQEGGFYATRRGLQKKLFWLTCVLGSLFIILSIVNLVV